MPYAWKNVQIVGGGFVDGIIFHPSEKGLRCAHFSAKTKNLFSWRAYLLPGPSGENAPGTMASAGRRSLAELHALDVCGLQPFGAGFHFKTDFGAFF